MLRSQEVIIKPFQPEYQDEVKRLILSGLKDHWGELDPAKNPDLNDIGSTYANASFLTAWMDGRLVGTGALIPRDGNVAEIVRMSVAGDMRRQGIGRLVLQTLCRQAREAGYQRVILETTETWFEVIAFYESYGFLITHRHEGDVYFALDLALVGQMK